MMPLFDIDGSRAEAMVRLLDDTHNPDWPAMHRSVAEALGVAALCQEHSDVVGATNAGMDAIHVDPLGLCYDSDHRHVTSFAVFVSELLGQEESGR